MSYNNLSKTFRYVNDNGDEITLLYDNGYLISKPIGIDSVNVATHVATGINQVGSTIQSLNVQPRTVNIKGVLVGENQMAHKTDLISVVRPDIGGRLYADDYYLVVAPTATPTIEAKNSFSRFQFSLYAAYPYWQHDESVRAAANRLERKFKFPWNISCPYSFGERIVTQFIIISNGGQIPVPYTAIFTAQADVSNPQLIDAKTNKYLRLNKNMVAGERLVVEITHERTYVTSSVDGECRGALDINSELYLLSVGDNAIKPTSDSGQSALSVEIQYATEIVGIAL